jgi:conjugal transfer/entry exclusion protein
MKRLCVLVVLLGVLSLPQVAHAQLIVFDPANFGQDLIQSAQLILSVANQILELTGLDGIAIADTYAADMGDLSALATEGAALMGDIGSLNAQITTLFDLSTAPSNSTDLSIRLSQIRQTVYTMRSYAIRTQALIRTLNNTVTHLTGLVDAIGDYVGGMQARQSLNQSMAELNKTQGVLAAQTAAYNNAETIAKMEEPLIIESLRNIHAAQYADWPGYLPPP